MSKVRINDLARELEVKSRAILDSLTAVGVTEKKTHSSSLEEDEAERVRQHFQRTGGRNGAGAPKAVDNEPKQKIDWSRVSKPGDVLKAIQQRKDEAAAIAQRPPAPQAAQPQAAKPGIPARPPVSSSSPASNPASSPLPAPAGSVQSAAPAQSPAVPRPARPASPVHNRGPGCIQPASQSGCARAGPARAGEAESRCFWLGRPQSGRTRTTFRASTAACAAADCAPTPSGTADCRSPAAFDAGHCRQATHRPRSCQASSVRGRSASAGSGRRIRYRLSKTCSPGHRSAPASGCCGSCAASACSPAASATQRA